jgi:hypothetical protein
MTHTNTTYLLGVAVPQRLHKHAHLVLDLVVVQSLAVHEAVVKVRGVKLNLRRVVVLFGWYVSAIYITKPNIKLSI